MWHDRILRLALVFMLVPLGAVWEAVSKAALVAFVTGHTVQVPNVMQAAPAVTPDNVLAVLPAVIPEITVVPPEVQPAPVTVSMDLFWVLTAVWAVGAAATLCWKLWTYRRFRKLLNGERRPLSAEGTEVFASCKRELGVNGEVEVSVMPGVPTPMVTGLLRPVILLPDVPLSGEELRYLFLHELTHIKRRDLWVRFFALWGVVLHWYNPFMHLLDRKIKDRSEQSCDERVARSMSRAERLAYGGMLLKLASEPAFKAGTWAVTLSTRESIQKRLGSIVKAGRWTRMDKIVALVTAAGLLCCGTVIAVTAQEPLKIEEKAEKDQIKEEVKLPDSLEDDGEAKEYSTIQIGDAEYECYLDNRGVARLKNAVGNGDLLANYDYLVLPTLENGEYSTNSLGETYGYQQLADFVGESPDLIAVVRGLDMSGTKEIDGYVWWEDYFAAFSDPDVAARYESSPDGIIKDARARRDAEWWRIPLYNAEHDLIGTYDTYEGKHLTHGNLVWRLQNDSLVAAASATKDTGIEKSNHGNHLQEIPYSYLTQERREMLSKLPNSTYPQNSNGEYYGPAQLKNYLQIEPDLISATGTKGEEGYIWWQDAELRFQTVSDLDSVTWTENGYLIPLYDSEHNQIGWKEEAFAIATSDAPTVILNRQTVNAIKAQLS